MKTIMKIGFAILLAGILVSSFQGAESTPAKVLLALSKRDRTLAIVDPASLKILAKIPVGPDPHEVIADAEGKFAYVSDYGGGAYHELSVVDLVEQKALPPIDLGPLSGPHGLVFAGGKVWFTAEGAKVIGSYDPASKKIDWVLGTGQDRTHMIYVFDGLKLILTSNVASATMTFIEKTAGRGFGPPPGQGGPPPGGRTGPPPGAQQVNWEETVVPVGRGAEGFDVSHDGREIWAANAQDGTISIIDVASKRVTETLAANVRGANRLKFTPDGKQVFVSSLGSSDLAIFDAASHHEVKRVKLGHGAAGILMDADGSRAFVACSPDNYVAVIDLETLEVVGRFEPGNDPDGLAWAVRP
ncbi:MAG TPA: YncE family protein [Terriglobia bacterium]|nr:YncE family protein [Terriglobia bacterium]